MTVWATVIAASAIADPFMIPVSISAGPLPSGLHNLERQTGIELLYDGELIDGLDAPAVNGELTPEDALRQVLAETDLRARRAASGAWVIERPETPPLAQQDAAVAEILVVGRRTQNADIRRFEDDVQPYTVTTQAELARSHRDNIDQFFASRITASTTVVPSGQSQNADTLSDINLRGLGSEATLVLVDGRRMPSIPAGYSEFRQADVNPIPLHAIKRIEVLTGAAGGIHGFGALGGVVNVVLDRDTHGIELHVTGGISSRGDAPRQSFEAKFGHTFNGGATDFSLSAAHNQVDTVTAGERDYVLRDRRRTAELIPELYESGFPDGNSVSVRTLFRIDPETFEFELNPHLTFKPEYGGATLPSHFTFLSAGFSGGPDALAASLSQHAGQVDFSLSKNAAQTDLGSNPRSDALLANVRHRFGERFEAYLDAVVLRSRGESHGDSLTSGLATGGGYLSPESPANPFTDDIFIDFPYEGLEDEVRKRFESTRYTAGLVAELPFDWRGTAEWSSGGVDFDVTSSAETLLLGSLLLLGDPSDLDTNPLGDWDAFQRAIAVSRYRYTLNSSNHTQFRDGSLRLAGPVFSTPAGPATLTLLAERRTERVPAYTNVGTRETEGTTEATETSTASSSTATNSYYAELHTRLFDESATPIIRGLELQLAIRRDEEKDDFATDPQVADPEFVQAKFTGTAYTAGLKVSPTRWLMLRGSYATGEQPPPLYTLNELEEMTWDVALATDPKRADTDLGANGDYLLKWGGFAGLKATLATTVSLGMVLTPTGADGPRIAIDYSRIRRTRDVMSLSAQEILTNEDHWPQRVERAALTDEDRANGYTAGAVTMLDTRFSNDAALDVDAIDLHADWPMQFLGGRLNWYADATYHKRNVLKAPFQPDVNMAGYMEGPLRRRANGGFDWSKGPLELGANLQYFGSNLVLTQGPLSGGNEINVEMQGSTRVPSQTYLDLHAAWRLPVQNFGALDDLTLDFGVVNALDKMPPRENEFVFSGPGYSRYGDPRQRRFELGLSCHF